MTGALEPRPPTVELHDDEGNLVLLVWIVGRTYPQARDYIDGNWLSTDVEVRTPDGYKRFKAELRSEELARFVGGLRNIEHDRRGTALMGTLDDWLDITIRAQGTGTFEADLSATWVHGEDNGYVEHAFRLTYQQVMEVRSNVEKALKRFPVIRGP